MPEIFYFAVIFVLSWTGIELFRRWSLKRRLFDIPNERSSHTRPTPRGGGLIIVVVNLISYTLYTNFVSGNFAWGYFIGAILIAAISWLDDLYTIKFYWRFLAHSTAALLIIFSIGYFRFISLPICGTIEFGAVGAIIGFLWIVWLTNAYNFMDGIDGIAGVQAFSAGIGWLLIGKITGLNDIGFYGGAIAFSSLGFLIFNWQPAKIFMGDVGSAFLGYSFAAMPFLAKNEFKEKESDAYFLLFAALILVWLFVFDTIFTFFRRLLKREKVWEAHRSHFYQKLIIGGLSHRVVAGIYGLISLLNVLFLIFWYKEKGIWEIALISSIILTSMGILIYTFRKEKQRYYSE